MGEEDLANLGGLRAIKSPVGSLAGSLSPDCLNQGLARFRYRIRRFGHCDHRAAWHRCPCGKPDEMDTRGSQCKESDTVRRTAPEPR